MELYKRIKQRRIELGMTQQELAEKVGLKTKGAICRIEAGERDISQKQVLDFAKALKTTPAFLFGGEVSPPEPSNISAVYSHNIYNIPLYESVSAGFGSYADDSIVDYVPLHFNNAFEASQSLCIKVSGDSMFPKIEDGDTIIVQRQDSVDSGDVAVLLIDNEEGVVKKVIYDEENIELHSFNPMYPVRKFSGADVLRVRVVGRVRKIIKDL